MPIPNYSWGPFTFSSGYAPQQIKGPMKDTHIIEHEIPAREGGIVEYLGSRQQTYQLRGFLSPPQDGPFNGTAAAVLSGTSYLGLNADDAKDMLFSLRGSGAQLLKLESTSTKASGYSNFFENDFYYATKLDVAYEPGRTYPYYPYSIELRRASTNTYGNTSGIVAAGAGYSGFIWGFQLISGLPQGQAVIGLGANFRTVASGNFKMAVYNSGGATLQAQSASQAVYSGWNYFPLRPSFITVSGTAYILAFKGDSSSSSGYNLATDTLDNSGQAFSVSGIAYSADFPASITVFVSGYVSGFAEDLVMVTA